jgi:tetratricopeptide (TPR) repeat protein
MALLSSLDAVFPWFVCLSFRKVRDMIRGSLARSAFIGFVLIVAVSSANAQVAHTLEGKVHLPNGDLPPHSVKVTLTFNGARVYETFTDLSGRFSFGPLRRGIYHLIAEGDGEVFETTTVRAEVSAYVSAAQTFTQNIQLKPKAGKPLPRAAVVSAEELDASIPEQARKSYQKGMKDGSDQKPENAIKHFQKAIEAHPQFYLAHVGMAEQYAKLNRYDEAIAAFRKAIELKADRAAAQVGLGVTLVKQKKYSDALGPLRRSIEIENQYSTPYLFLGLAEMMTGDYTSAETNLLRAYQIDKPALSHIYLANLYDLKGEPAKAIQHLEAFLKENPDNPNAGQIREVIKKLRTQKTKDKDEGG